MNKNKKWYIINWSSGWRRCIKLFKLYPIVDQSNKDMFLVFGYKNLTSGDKETYYLLRDLALLQEKTTGTCECKVTLSYLADVFNTTIECQSRRITNLKNSHLLTITKTGNSKSNASIYVPIIRVMPDSTLISTIIRLLRRKNILELIKQYIDEKDNLIKENILKDIKKCLAKTPYHKHLLPTELKKILSF